MKSRKRVWSAELAIRNLKNKGKKVSEFLGVEDDTRKIISTCISEQGLDKLSQLKKSMNKTN